MSIFSKLFNGNEKPNFNALFENENFKNFISKAEDISLGYGEINIFKLENIEKEQIGYSVSENGKSLTGNKNGDWKKNWIVIATDNMDDPIFVDIENQNLPVFIAEHGNGEWEENYIAISIENFSQILNDLKQLSIKRENPVQIEKNPISETELEIFLSKTKEENKGMDVEYWKIFLEND
ncbi:hypothetical protein FVB9288_01671 [Flavobacterium sp. CECT 9288]|uniref:hypothetical protein n=1 Tax=Flavobacterium sp. CECT 9288 TaxID=2845819 RepID=UPI001E48F0DD|nr:hypothetical protein [Flavobacterium sp. CECT 9288]CAH0335999.1 hypothetical protein FVB9288_01671 [Flavobacterium sp. CECT 9288]